MRRRGFRPIISAIAALGLAGPCSAADEFLDP
jgi:hypothetical protein